MDEIISLPVDEYLKLIGELSMRLRHAQLVIKELNDELAKLKGAGPETSSDSDPPSAMR